MDDELRMGFGEQMTDVLRRAGYELDSERAVKLGVLAYNMAALLRIKREGGEASELPGGASPAGRGKVGRNERCPCGSGRKYKKCCLPRLYRQGRGPIRPTGPWMLDPALVPNLSDAQAVRRDLEILSDLFESVPALREVRFARQKTCQFLEDELTRLDPEPGSEREKLIDELAQRYAVEVDGGELLGRLDDLLLQAASGPGLGAEQLRSLALGIVLGRMTGKQPELISPLASVIFRKSVFEHLDSISRVDEMIDQFGDREDVKRRLDAGDPDLQKTMQQLAEQMDPCALDALKESSLEMFDKISGLVRQGRFPVPVPLATVLPLLLELSGMTGAVDWKDDERVEKFREKAVELIEKTVDNADPEALRLLCDLLDAWLRDAEKSTGEAPGTGLIALVHVARSQFRMGEFSVLGLDFVLGALCNGRVSAAEGVLDLGSPSGKKILTPEYLERYGECLMERGYPALARRIRAMGERLGPVNG